MAFSSFGSTSMGGHAAGANVQTGPNLEDIQTEVRWTVDIPLSFEMLTVS